MQLALMLMLFWTVLDTSPENNLKNMQYLQQLWNYVSSKLKHQGPLYSEGGPLDADVQGKIITTKIWK